MASSQCSLAKKTVVAAGWLCSMDSRPVAVKRLAAVDGKTTVSRRALVPPTRISPGAHSRVAQGRVCGGGAAAGAHGTWRGGNIGGSGSPASAVQAQRFQLHMQGSGACAPTPAMHAGQPHRRPPTLLAA